MIYLVQQIGTKDKALVFFKRSVEFLEKDKHPWTVTIVRTDAEPVYNSQVWANYYSAPDSVKQHEVSAPYKHGQNGVPEERTHWRPWSQRKDDDG